MSTIETCNTPLAKALAQVVDAGWANKSSGDVEAPTGAFALITISVDEVSELYSAVFDDDLATNPTLLPGAFVLVTDSDGNHTLTQFGSGYTMLDSARADAHYHKLDDEYQAWPHKDDWKRAAIQADIQAFGEFFTKGGDLDE